MVSVRKADFMSDKLVGYFGFGSLVNKHTLRTSYVDIMRASLKGYSRHWQARSTAIFDNHISLLSIHPDETCTIKGMIVLDLLENLPLVDQREEGYSRHKLEHSQLEVSPNVELPEEIYVYIADEVEGASDDGALLQSYLDAVMQGFRNEYGTHGVSHFVDTTKGFNRAINLDRHMPLYPRNVELMDHEKALFDMELKRAGVLGL
jgi:cation transport regulator ChaC